MAFVICVWCPEHHVIREDPRLKEGDSHGMCEAAKDRELASVRALPTKEVCPHGDTEPALCLQCQCERGVA